MRKGIAAFGIILFVCAAVVFAAGPDMKPGKWETTMSMEMPGMPFKMPPMTTTQCITKKDLEDPKRIAPTGGKKDECEVKGYTVKGNKATWTVQCKDGSTGSGEMISQGNSYSGTMKMKMKDSTEMKYTIKGKRIGDC